LRIAPVDHETGFAQHLHVPRHPALARVEPRHQFADAMLSPIPEDRECRTACRVANGGQDILHDRKFMRHGAYTL